MIALNPTKRLGIALAAIAALLAWGCRSGDSVIGEPGKQAHSGGNSLRGTVVDNEGRPVRGAKVAALPETQGLPPLAKAGVAGPPVRTSATDGEGRYLFTDMAPGAYSLQGQDDAGNRVFLRRGVEYAGAGLAADIGADTLRMPGILQGRVTDWYEDRSGILCAIPGTSYLAITDSAGAFTMGAVPQGDYVLSCRLEGFSPAYSEKTRVLSGAASRAAPVGLIPLPETPTPAPQGLRAEYDSARGVVTLHWHPSRFPGFGRYHLAAGPAETLGYWGIQPFTFGTYVDDTTFVDSLWRYTMMDTALFHQTHPGLEPEPFAISVTYSLTTADSDYAYNYRLPGNAVTVRVDSDRKRWSQNRIYDLREIGRPTHLDEYGRMHGEPVALGDTVRLVFRWRDSFLTATQFIWGPNRNNYTPAFKVRYPESRDFQDTLIQAVDANLTGSGFAAVHAVIRLRRSADPADVYQMSLTWNAPLVTAPAPALKGSAE